MNIAAALVLGLLIGWIVEWIIDWVYWRKRNQQVTDENIILKQQIESLQAENARLSEATVIAKTSKPRTKKDDLKKIVGIGPVIAKKLNQAGITTFEQMAELKPKELENILGELIKRLSDEDDLIAQARELARQKQKKA